MAKIKSVILSEEAIVKIFSGANLKLPEGIPKTATYLGCFFDIQYRTSTFYFTDTSFEDLPVGAIPQILDKM